MFHNCSLLRPKNLMLRLDHMFIFLLSFLMVILNYSLILNKRNRTLDGLLNLKWNLAEYVILIIRMYCTYFYYLVISR